MVGIVQFAATKQEVVVMTDLIFFWIVFIVLVVIGYTLSVIRESIFIEYARPLQTEEWIYRYTQNHNCSEYDVFLKAGLCRGYPTSKIKTDFKRYLFTGWSGDQRYIPFYVRRFCNINKNSRGFY